MACTDRRILAAAFNLIFSCALPLQAATPAPIPAGLGVNIHFTDPAPGEMDMLAAGGFTVVRMDFTWSRTEKSPGQYDFSAYERLLKALEPHHIRALFILDYVNEHYDNNRSPDSDAGRAAFARWAAAAVKHFAGRSIIWEMYNEPNITPFWRPKPNTDDYTKLALEVGKAIRAAAPNETYIGPACSTMDFPFLESCFKAGLLEYFAAVSVHPYRPQVPETVEADYRKLRGLIARYAPKGKSIPIYSGEWGYSSIWSGLDDAKQGQLLARQWLTNLANDVPLSIWYDWHDDGEDPKEPEHHFGTVGHGTKLQRSPIYDPKPAYDAAKTLTGTLRGYAFNKRLALENRDDHLLLFQQDVDHLALVAWTTGDSHEVTIPASPRKFRVISHTGAELPELTADANGLRLTLAPSPQYLLPQKPNELLLRAAKWERLQSEYIASSADWHRVMRNRPKEAESLPTLSPEPIPFRSELVINGIRLEQESWLISATPIRLVPFAPRDGIQGVRVESLSPVAFDGAIRFKDSPQSSTKLLHFESTDRALTVVLPDAHPAAIELLDERGNVGLTLPPTRMELVPLKPDSQKLIPDGDKKVPSTQRFEPAGDLTDAPAKEMSALKIDYDFATGWKFIRLQPVEPIAIAGKGATLGMWIRGDGSRNALRVRFADSTGQTFQPDGPRVTWRDWRYVEFPLDGSTGPHWGGANDGVIHEPIKLTTLLLIDSGDRAKTNGEVIIAEPTLNYPLPP